MSDEQKKHDGSIQNQANQTQKPDQNALTGLPAKEAAPVTQPVTPSKVGPITTDEDSDNKLLIKIMLQREMRLAKEEELKAIQKDKRDKQREFNAKHHYDAKIERQVKCRHKKGGRSGPKSQVTDFAVYYHTFINNEAVIKCMLCGAKWKVNDTKQYLVRNGKHIPNHTKIGWEEAMVMVGQSTNTPTSSEVPLMVQSAVTDVSLSDEEIPNID